METIAAAGLPHHRDGGIVVDADHMTDEELTRALNIAGRSRLARQWPKQEVAWALLSEHAHARASEVSVRQWTEFLRTKRPWYRHLRQKHVGGADE